MFCPKCGHDLPAEQMFCPNCGADLSEYTTSAGAELPDSAAIRNRVEEATKEPRAPGKKRIRKFLRYVYGVVCALFLILLAWHMLTERSVVFERTDLPETTEQNDGTIYVDEEIAALSGYFENSVRFIDQYQGHRVALDTTLMPDSFNADYISFHVIAEDYSNVFIYCYADRDTISSMSSNSYYVVIGTIEDADAWSITMRDCEFILAE